MLNQAPVIRISLFLTLLALFLTLLTAPLNSSAAQAGVIAYTPNLSLSQLQGRPDTDQVELSDGRRIRLGDVRRMTRTAQKARSNPPGSLLPAELKPRPAATGGIPLRTRTDLDQALQRPNTDTVVLPSGKRITVGLLKLLQPQVEEQRRVMPRAATPQRPVLTGETTRVSAITDWYAILLKPDATVLETLHGKRITVGELKQAVSSGSLRKPAAAVTR